MLNGETRTGVTTMRIDAGLDTGDMLLKAETEIGPDENAVELGQRLAAMGADLLVETLAGLAAGGIVPRKAGHCAGHYAPLLKKEDGRIDWSRRRPPIHNRVRGLQPWPGALHRLPRPDAAHLEIAAVERDDAASSAAGTLVSLKPPVVSCGGGAPGTGGSATRRPQAHAGRAISPTASD